MGRVHGVISISLVFVAQVIAMAVMFLESLILGIGYSVLLIVASMSVVYFYCTKCPIRLSGCRHVIVGPVTQVFPERQQGPYSKLDYLMVIISLGTIILLPQVWLWNHPKLMMGFWVILAVAGIEINRFVCRDCENVNCIACRKQETLN
jgi:hypothetical protein